jgi:hypothetical protein
VKPLIAALQALVHLFVEDGSLTILILAVVLTAAAVAHFTHASHLPSGAILLVGCLAALLGNVLGAARHRL